MVTTNSLSTNWIAKWLHIVSGDIITILFTQNVLEPKRLPTIYLTGAIFSLRELWLPCSRVFVFTAACNRYVLCTPGVYSVMAWRTEELAESYQVAYCQHFLDTHTIIKHNVTFPMSCQSSSDFYIDFYFEGLHFGPEIIYNSHN